VPLQRGTEPSPTPGDSSGAEKKPASPTTKTKKHATVMMLVKKKRVFVASIREMTGPRIAPKRQKSGGFRDPPVEIIPKTGKKGRTGLSKRTCANGGGTGINEKEVSRGRLIRCTAKKGYVPACAHKRKEDGGRELLTTSRESSGTRGPGESVG